MAVFGFSRTWGQEGGLEIVIALYVTSANQCVLEECREPRAFGRDPYDALQLRPYSPNVALHPGDGGGRQHDPSGDGGHGEGAGGGEVRRGGAGT